MYEVPELEIPLEDVTLEDCLDMYEKRGRTSVLNDGKLWGFEKEPADRTD